jgi:hypothetical protein
MKITIQAIFPGGEEARLAASSLAMAQGGGLELSISTHQPLQGISLRAPLASADGAASGGGAMVTVICGPEQEAFVMGELAALGARRVVQTRD